MSMSIHRMIFNKCKLQIRRTPTPNVTVTFSIRVLNSLNVWSFVGIRVRVKSRVSQLYLYLRNLFINVHSTITKKEKGIFFMQFSIYECQ